MTDATIITIPGGGACPQPGGQDAAIRRVADLMHRLNRAVTEAVDAGASVELMRVSRYHCGNGRWGDQLQPVVRVSDGAG